MSNQLVHRHVIQDLLEALHDEDMSDITLVGKDGAHVQANRFVLAARSKVMKRMLYGNFREAASNEIPFYDYDRSILEAVVEYCCRNEISKFRLYIHRNSDSARRLVQLYKAADFLDLLGLARLVVQMAHNLTSRYPPLACAVFDEADLNTKISKDALLMIQCRPYVTLPPHQETGGGIDNLSPHKLACIFKDNEVKASEFFLFKMLQTWVEVVADNTPEPLQVAKKCTKYLALENIEPQNLLSDVLKSGFCAEKKITTAITIQALRASQSRVWTLSSRGRPDIERILVEGAGSMNANGIYYRIDGLENGDLYSKREVACGQQFVYTLSISINAAQQVECRIFCSKLLTHRAVKSLALNGRRESTFQPLLQVIRLDGLLVDDDLATAEKGSFLDSSSKNMSGTPATMQLSDGEHFIKAVMAPQLRRSTRSREIIQNTLIKVLDFERHGVDGEVVLQINRVSIVSQDPGLRFGNPAYIFDIFDEKDKMDSQPIVTADAPIETQICQDLIRRQDNSITSGGEQTLLELYSCQYPLSQKPVDSKIPNIGWQIDSHGTSPGPRCRWIPGQPSTPKDSNNNNNNNKALPPSTTPTTAVTATTMTTTSNSSTEGPTSP